MGATEPTFDKELRIPASNSSASFFEDSASKRSLFSSLKACDNEDTEDDVLFSSKIRLTCASSFSIAAIRVSASKCGAAMAPLPSLPASTSGNSNMLPLDHLHALLS